MPDLLRACEQGQPLRQQPSAAGDYGSLFRLGPPQSARLAAANTVRAAGYQRPRARMAAPATIDHEASGSVRSSCAHTHSVNPVTSPQPCKPEPVWSHNP
eukprot:6623043-Prymnesium_polylepis.1